MTKIKMLVATLGFIGATGMITACDGMKANKNTPDSGPTLPSTTPKKETPTATPEVVVATEIHIISELQKISAELDSNNCSSNDLNSVINDNQQRLARILKLTHSLAGIKFETDQLVSRTSNLNCKINMIATIATRTVDQHNLNYKFGDGLGTLPHAANVLAVIKPILEDLKSQLTIQSQLPESHQDKWSRLTDEHTALVNSINESLLAYDNYMLELAEAHNKCKNTETCEQRYLDVDPKMPISLDRTIEVHISIPEDYIHEPLATNRAHSGPDESLSLLELKINKLKSIDSFLKRMLERKNGLKRVNAVLDAIATGNEIDSQAASMDRIATEQDKIENQLAMQEAYYDLEVSALTTLTILENKKNSQCSKDIVDALINQNDGEFIKASLSTSTDVVILWERIKQLINKADNLDCRQNVISKIAQLTKQQHQQAASFGEGQKTIDHASLVAAYLTGHQDELDLERKTIEDARVRKQNLQEAFVILGNEIPVRIEVLKASLENLKTKYRCEDIGCDRTTELVISFSNKSVERITKFDIALAIAQDIDEENIDHLEKSVKSMNHLHAAVNSNIRSADTALSVLVKNLEPDAAPAVEVQDPRNPHIR